MSKRAAARKKAAAQKGFRAIGRAVKNVGKSYVSTIKSLRDDRSYASGKNPQNDAMRKALEANRKKGIVSDGVGVSYKRKPSKPGDLFNAHKRKMGKKC